MKCVLSVKTVLNLDVGNMYEEVRKVLNGTRFCILKRDRAENLKFGIGTLFVSLSL